MYLVNNYISDSFPSLEDNEETEDEKDDEPIANTVEAVTKKLRKLKSYSKNIVENNSESEDEDEPFNNTDDAVTEELRKLKSYSKTEWRILRRSSRLL